MAVAASVLRPGESITFSDRDDLLAKLGEMAVEVPERPAKRTIEDREHFVMRGYLRFLAGEDLLPLPVTLRTSAKNQDPPDFLLEWPDGQRESFELTDGSTREYQRRLTDAARSGDKGLILPIDLQTPGREAAERWAQILLSSFREKSMALARGRYSIDHLLIYDMTGLGLFSPLEEGVPLLRAAIADWLDRERPAHRFARVSVLRGFDLLLDVMGEARLLSATSPHFRLGSIAARDEEDLRRRWRAIDRYCRENSIRHLKLFGSALRHDIDEWAQAEKGRWFDDESDLDLLVEFEPGTVVTLLDMARMKRELSELMGFPVDLRTAGDLSRYFRQQVLSEAVALDAR